MSRPRTLLASLLIAAAGVATLAAATDGFRAYTSQTALRLSVARQPRPLPSVLLETADGQRISLSALRGRWLLVDFVYTRCTTWCLAQGGTFARLQRELAGPIAQGRVALLSLSFDPERDDPEALAAYRRRMGGRAGGWVVARPADADGLQALLRTFGVVVLPDGLGGYVHNAAINVVDPQGRLVAVTDWQSPDAALAVVRQGLAE
ncbi:MAG: SCO family protein [Thermomonas sp.]|uniref:SCO family protein n=1 Tax=Thermomonas sp. TaxID=1971895 RepID=UPI001D5A3499|nr:SCO family protein [Thermomonas sp.]MBZ0087691.1 SCO family protein [Thermomonas sp.]